MKNPVFIAVLLVLSLALSCNKETITGSGNIISEDRETTTFSQISNEGIIDVTITQGDSRSVTILADDNIIDRVKTEVINGELMLYLEGENFRDISARATITTTRLTGIRNSGTGKISANDLEDEVNFAIYNSGTGDIILNGSAENLMLENEGTGTIYAFEFPVENAVLTIIGSGNCEVYCSESLDVYIEGSGNVLYKGNPTIEVEIKGSGEVINTN